MTLTISKKIGLLISYCAVHEIALTWIDLAILLLSSRIYWVSVNNRYFSLWLLQLQYKLVQVIIQNYSCRCFKMKFMNSSRGLDWILRLLHLDARISKNSLFHWKILYFILTSYMLHTSARNENWSYSIPYLIVWIMNQVMLC